jgi:hypothetical protein
VQPVQSLQPTQTKPNPSRRGDILLILFSSLGIFGLLIRGVYMAITGIQYFNPTDSSSLASNMLNSLAMLFCAGLLLPMFIFSVNHLKGKESIPVIFRTIKFGQAAGLATVWLVVVIIGAVINSLFDFGWAVAAPFFLLGISLPIMSLIWIGAGGLPSGSRRRIWSVFGFGMVGSTVTALLLEYLVIGIAVITYSILAISNPELRIFFDQIKTQVASANTMDIQTLLVSLAPYITNPLVILSVLIFAAILTPMIEEAVKPAIIWFLGKRLHTPAEGFVLGALCGAGFATLEGLMSASGATQMWGFGLVGRAAASLLHITSSGLLGWGIASARLEKRYGRLAMTYLLSISLHGLWNGSAIIAVYGALRMVVGNNQIDTISALFMLGGLGILFIELCLLLAALPLINRHLRKLAIPVAAQMQSDIIAPPAISELRETNGLDS